MKRYAWHIVIAILCLAIAGVFLGWGEELILGLPDVIGAVAALAVVVLCIYLFVLAVLAPYFLYRLYRSGLAVEKDLRSIHVLLHEAAQRIDGLPQTAEADAFDHAQEEAAEATREAQTAVERTIRRNHLREIHRGQRRRWWGGVDAGIARAVGEENTIIIAALGGAFRILAVAVPLAGIVAIVWFVGGRLVR